MKINQISFKQDKNETQLNNKAVNVESLIPTPTNLIPAISLYDSDWVDVIPEDIVGATTQVENYELPQKVPFEFSFNLEVPEVYLPFVNIAILAKPSTDQKVIGSGQFIFSSLREVTLTLYTWKGATQALGAVVPPNPIPPPPSPSGCYVNVGVYPVFIYNFKHQAIHFPVPNDTQSTLPCGALFPGAGGMQYWESEGEFTFQEYMNLGYTYTQTKALMSQYYPEIFVTPESHGVPYKCYRRIDTDTVVSGDEKIKVTKTDAKNFQYSVYGNLLLVSPAITETTWSDPDFPTYKPDSTSLSTRLKVFFKEHPVNFIQTKGYKK